MKRTLSCLVLVLLIGMLSLPANGKPMDGDLFSVENRAKKPIEITAGTASARNISNGVESVFKNNVTVRQGELTMQCDEMKLVYDEKAAKNHAGSKAAYLPKGFQSLSGLRSITASGNVKMAQDTRMAFGDMAVFDNRQRTITLTGSPARVFHGGDKMWASRIIIWLDENRVEMLPEKDRSHSDQPAVGVQINPGRNTPELPDQRQNIPDANRSAIRIRIDPGSHSATGSRGQ
ncbi:MAG: LptA/OstA family protein [Thermodesulfobacteriota bacterium]